MPKLDFILGLHRFVYNLSNAGLSNAHEEKEEAAVDLPQIKYEREETEKSRDNKQAIKEAL